MTLLLLNRKLVMTTSIAVLVVVISASAVAAWLSSERLRADDTHPLSNIMLERGVAIGQGWLNGSDSDIAAYVNEIPVSTAEFYVEQARARTYLDIALDRLDRAVSDEEYGAFIFEYIERQEQLGPGGTVEIPLFDGESPIPESTAAIIRTRIKVVQDHGVDTMALAVLIERYAFLSAAREAGFSAPELEVQGRVAERRTLFESVDVEPIQVSQAQEPSIDLSILEDYELQGIISEVGAETYWTQIAPRMTEYQITTDKWRSAVLDLIVDVEEKSKVQAEMEADALSEARTELTEHFTLDASHERAMAFLEAQSDMHEALQAPSNAEVVESDPCSNPAYVCTEEGGVTFIDPKTD